MKSIKSLFYGFLVILGLGLGVAACGGGNSNVQLPPAGPTPTPTPIPTAVPTATPIPVGAATSSVTLPASGTAATVPLTVPSNGVMGTTSVSIPATAQFPAGTTTSTNVTTGSVPSNLPQTFSFARSPQGTRNPSALGYPPLAAFGFNFSNYVTVNGSVSLSASFAPGVIAAGLTPQGATSDGTNWYYNTVPCTSTVNGSTGYTTVTCTFTGSYTLVKGQNYGFAIYLTGTPSSPTPPPYLSGSATLTPGANTITNSYMGYTIGATLAGVSNSSSLNYTIAGASNFAGLPAASGIPTTGSGALLYGSFIDTNAFSVAGSQTLSVTSPTAFPTTGSTGKTLTYYMALYSASFGWVYQAIGPGTLNGTATTLNFSYNCPTGSAACSFITNSTYGFVIYNQ